MCGIAGIVGSAPDPAVIERMVDRLRHRGPDDRGVWRSDDAHLGHARLAILDLSAAGHQPMVRDQLVITYNGEVYNFRELRRRLPGPFRSDCDTEVVLAAYAEEGDRCLHRLRGMFAFAVWDARRHRLFAARDRLGIKPLFYRALPGGLAFASEIKALLELGRPPVDESALRDYLTYRYIPAPKTVFAGIRELPPGHTLVWQGGGALEVARWWEPSAEVTVTDMGEAVERLGRLLEIAVPMHTLADVPVGVFLSGGIDSTTIAAFVDRPRTFTLGSRIGHRDEAPVARRVAAHFGAEHHELLAESGDLDLALDTQPRLYDQPFGDSGSWATFLVSRLAREHVTVALCGEGGDELFCGYQWYRRWTEPPPAAARALAGALPTFSALGRSLQRRVAAGLERYAAFLSPFTVEQKRALIGPRLEQEGYDDLWFFRRHWREELPPLKRLQWADLHTYLAGDLLARVDRASMAHSLELRPPLLDHELVELGLALDGPLLLDPATGTGKLVVRRLMAGRVPAGLFNRPKRGFNLPIRRWVARRPRLLSAALDRLAEAGIIRRPRALSFTGEQAWALLSLDRWVTSG